MKRPPSLGRGANGERPMKLYEVLGVSVNADEQEIRSAFRNLARRYHPDAGEGSSADEFRRVVEAYETLSDPERRREYDLSWRRPATARPAAVRTERFAYTVRPEPMVSPSGPFRRPSWPAPGPPRYTPTPPDYAPGYLFEEMLRFLDACFPGRRLRW